MTVTTITSGAHWRDVHVPQNSAQPRQFAHIFDPDEPEDVPHQASNFITYANAVSNNCSCNNWHWRNS